MDFEFSPKVQALQIRLSAFMAANVYPNEANWFREVDEAADRWQPPAIMENLKDRKSVV